MPELIKAEQPFRLFTRLHLSELTGLKAANIDELLELIKTVSGSSIYHHTHRFLQQHQYLSPEPPNDFAYWVSNVLGEPELGERLASIDTIQFSTIRNLREKITDVVEKYLRHNPAIQTKYVSKGAEFYFIKSISFIFPTNYYAHDLKELAEILKKITLDSIYYHVFEARLRLEKGNNDFSFWIEKYFGDKKLAAKISRLDPYSYTMEDLRKTLVKIIEKNIK
ncbi:MAG: DUF5752 family protein [Sedimentisphaerales bacterium]